MGFLTDMLYSQLFFTPPYPTHDYAGQTVIVTGANVGLGLEAARHILRLNCAKLILAVRTLSKGEEAKTSILESTNYNSACVEVWHLDLSSSASTKAFAKRAQGLERVDVLLENAGILPSGWDMVEGNEATIQVNVINTLLLAVSMLPKLRETAEKYKTTPHLVVVSSESHLTAKFTESETKDLYARFREPAGFSSRTRYGVSKLIDVLFVRELVKHSSAPPVINAVNPGFCYSDIDRQYSRGLRVVLFAVRFVLARSTEVGSRALVAGACAGPASHGEYMSDCANRETAAWVYTDQGARVQQRVYKETLAELEKIEPGISKNI